MGHNFPQTTFSKTWQFNHTTSSPCYPHTAVEEQPLTDIAFHTYQKKSNGKAENAVKMIKQLFTKCRESGQSDYLALLDWRNSP